MAESPSQCNVYLCAWPQLSAGSLSCCPMSVRVQQLLRCECRDTTIIWRLPDSKSCASSVHTLHHHFHKLELLCLWVGYNAKWVSLRALKEKPDLIFSLEDEKESTFPASDSSTKTRTFMLMTPSFSPLSVHPSCVGNTYCYLTEAATEVLQKAFNNIIIWALMWRTCNVPVVFVCLSSSAAVFSPSSCISKNNNQKKKI